ncbi:hypothetical protein H257_02286 [Aphanomyces astaci]|uniref:LNR domain-containing protein n=1 Tax=Aphanomyces astaci TaxID=112090 RepID=W4H3F4_APHAT|nr:hypothetical protein H257_02286 [Aphanomyces astaci]ETV85678.1 hypothetical protein H257_02286 [Aphanomyces astaci]RQM10667.1 hypothetical protein B5M09_007061 [Aphanomyces astaci]|eukprot:XP_009824150.1 hypothetical protein H257_02286 [Aphanomyces astaci]
MASPPPQLKGPTLKLNQHRNAASEPYVLGLRLRWFRRLVLTVVYTLHIMSAIYFLSLAYLMLTLTPFEATAMRAYAPRPSSILFLGMACLHLTPFFKLFYSSSPILRHLVRRVAARKTATRFTARSPHWKPMYGIIIPPSLVMSPNMSMATGHLLEISSETWIAGQMAKQIVDRKVSLFYAMVLASNCLITTWALLFRSSGLKKTLIGILDACLSSLLSAIIPLVLFLVPLVEYKVYGSGNESHDFTWLAQSVTSVRTLIVWTPVQPVMVMLPSIMNYLALQALSKRVRTTKGVTLRNVLVTPMETTLGHSSPLGHSSREHRRQPSNFVHPMLLAPTASMNSSIPAAGRGFSSIGNSIQSYVASKTQAFTWHQEHEYVLRCVIVLSVLWGLAVVAVAVTAEFYRLPCPPGCILDSAPWFSRSCNCIYFRWTCNSSNYDDVLDEYINATDLGQNLLFLHIRKCGLRQGLAAETMYQFQSLYAFHFEFTSMQQWNIPSSAIPNTVIVALIRHSLLDHVPLALQTPGPSLRSIFLVGSPLQNIPNAIFNNWQHLNSLWLSSTNLTEFPLPVLQMQDLEVLALDSNHISTIPPELHLLPNLYWVYLDSNNISVFPDSLVTARHGIYLYLNHNPIEFISDDVVAQLDPWYVDISSTVYCQQRQLPLLCTSDCSESCSHADWGNYFCDPECNSTTCQYDKGDCAF